MELDMPSSFPRESVPSVAEALQTCINKTVVVMIVKQHADDYNSCVVRVVRREICLDTLDFLAENGYSEGPDSSPQFSLHEGQQLEFYCTGNIENRAEKDLNKYTYLSYMGGVETDMTLHVKDSWKQKDLPAYVGTIRCRILNRSVHSETLCMHAAELKISLPKQMRQRGTINVARVRVPFYLITLASYLSHTLCKDDKSIWETVLKSLLGSSEFSSACRNAKRKTAESDEESVCRTMLLDWMKAQAMHVDKKICRTLYSSSWHKE
ncbi:uncharacterized protein LOC123554155 [Mercenaria mercenaria]|uniref:uncharacterized protein LOC123554155 n=1 Tax=Mercenaria mercenaria TaxID=6596 RepID=UPI00234F7E0C|nr:uncharacterized protein LOC123554155 [Mercenaria mercenaria]